MFRINSSTRNDAINSTSQIRTTYGNPIAWATDRPFDRDKQACLVRQKDKNRVCMLPDKLWQLLAIRQTNKGIQSYFCKANSVISSGASCGYFHNIVT